MVGHPSLHSLLWWLLGSKDDSALDRLISCLIVRTCLLTLVVSCIRMECNLSSVSVKLVKDIARHRIKLGEERTPLFFSFFEVSYF